MNHPNDTRSRVISCQGALSAERRLLEQLTAVRASAPEELARPVRVVVPSRSLRVHVLRRVVGELGASAGVVVQTLHGLAREVLDNAAAGSPRGDAGFEVLVRRLARGERALMKALDDLDEGYDTVIGAVRDLLDAGFEPELEEGVIEKLDDLSGSVARARLVRARALVKVASKVHRATDQLGLWRLARTAQRAEELLATDCGLLSTRALIVHGFADVTGIAADLLRVVVRCTGGVVIIDRPADPADPASEDGGTVYLDRLLQGLAHLDVESDGHRNQLPELRLVEAPDPESEVRRAGERIREILATGCDPEEIGVVARGLDALGPVIRRHFGRLGIPCSGVSASVPGPSRRLDRLADVLVRGGGCEVDVWTESWGDVEDRTEVLLGMRTLGVLRVSDAAALDPLRDLRGGVRLPVTFDGDDDTGENRDPRLLAAGALEAVADRARRFARVVAEWPAAAPASAHGERAIEVMRVLGWTADSDDWREVERCLAEVETELEPSFLLERGEWLALVGARLRGRAQVPIGGNGGGVQILTVMEARARTFRHLFVIAVNRGVFPRVLADDALLPEALRLRLSMDVLPHMPVRARSADEERYLFAQLMSAAPEVTVSWHLAAGDAKYSQSSFVDRLALRAQAPTVERTRALWDPDGGNEVVRPAWEHAVVAAMRSGGAGLEPLIEAALVEGTAAGGGRREALAEVAAARTAVLAAVEPTGTAGPGPWSGYVGPEATTPEGAFWITHLEDSATCPWRAFVNRRLGVRPLADPHLDLPDPGMRLTGLVVHDVLEAIVLDVVDERVSELGVAMDRSPLEVPWPAPERFEELLRDAARHVARQEGLSALGLGPLLAARARPFLQIARQLEWADRGRLDGVLAAETVGEARLADPALALAFRADRVDGTPDGALLVDYKTGAPWTRLKSEDKRRRDVLVRVARGRGLQAVAYALAPDGGGVGRYVFLRPDVEGSDEMRMVTLASDDAEAVGLFAEAVRAVLAARSNGVVFPRVAEADSDGVPAHCTYCAVAECCLRSDSSFRRRLIAEMGVDDGDESPPVTAARRLWWLGVDREERS